MRNGIFIFFFLTGMLTQAQQVLDTLYINSPRPDSIFIAGSTPLQMVYPDSLELYRPAWSMADVLGDEAMLDMRGFKYQGGFADLSVRGGQFNQYAIMINGLPVIYPQTGHHQMQLPVDPLGISRVEIFDNGMNAFGINNAYTGGINIDTWRGMTSARALAAAGSYGSLRLAGAGEWTKKPFSLQAHGFYLKGEGYHIPDSVQNLDYQHSGGFIGFRYDGKYYNVEAQYGYTESHAGLNRYYSPYFPWQYERIYAAHAGVKILAHNKFHELAGLELAYNTLADRFEVFREDLFRYQQGYFIREIKTGGQVIRDTAQYSPGNYYKGANLHRTGSFYLNFYMGKYYQSVPYPNFWKIGVNLSINSMYSNRLGDRIGFFGPISLDGVLLNYYSLIIIKNAYFQTNLENDEWRVQAYFKIDWVYMLPGFSITRKIHSPWMESITMSMNSGNRFPSFTELYYDGPTNKGNPGLAPEQNWEASLRTKGTVPDIAGLHWKANLFYRFENKYIDWIKRPDENYWHAENLKDKETWGASALVDYDVKKYALDRIHLQYQYILSNKKEKDFDSKYGTDYLRHHFRLSIYSMPVVLAGKNMYFFLSYEYKQRNGLRPYLENGHLVLSPYQAYGIWNTGMNIRFSKHWDIFFRVDNLTGVQAYDLAFVPIPGRWMSGGVQVHF